MNNFDIIIVGGGASGLLAAGRAAELGAKVLILEKMMKVGRKLRISGKGRGNLTNSAEKQKHIQQFGKNGKFLYQAYGNFFSQELIYFLKEIDIETKEERGGRIFPVSDSAQDVVDALFKWNIDLGVIVKCNSTVNNLIEKDGEIIGVSYSDEDGEHQISTKKVVLSTGGSSYQLTGSTGDGFDFLKNFGHTIHELYPYLIPLETENRISRDLAKFILKNIRVDLRIDNKIKANENGELMFLPFGLAGASILKLSKYAVPALLEGKSVKVELDLKPALDDKKLDQRLIREIDNHKNSFIKKFLATLLPSPLIPFFMSELELEKDFKVKNINKDLRKKIRVKLKCWSFKITKHRPLEEALVTGGGIDLSEINPRTMESLFVKNLFVVGELLDLAADTGGYNLQAAFSTGYLAGESAANSL